jgi:hypothetical protein
METLKSFYMHFSEIDPVYIILIMIGGSIALVFIMAALWRWIFKVDQQLNNQTEIIRLLKMQCKMQGADDEELNAQHAGAQKR